MFLGDDKPILVKKNQENNRSRGNSESKNKSKVEFERSELKKKIVLIYFQLFFILRRQ